jgi:predicted MFS family arabinose efflux permease
VLARVTAPFDDYRALLRRQGYASFAATVFVSRVTGAMFTVTGVLLVLERTGSAPLAGLTSAAAVIPGAISGPLLGAWLDVVARRRVLVVVDQLLSAVALVALVLLAGHAPNWTLPVVTVLYSITRPFSVGTFFSALAELAGMELLGPASAVEASSLNLAFIVGPGLAGVLAGASGAARVVLLQAVATVIVALLIARNPAFEARSQDRAEGVSHALRTGLRALAREPVLRATSIAVTLAAAGWGFMVVGFPLLAAQSLHAGAPAGGYLWAAIGAGSILGTVAISGSRSLQRVAISYLTLGISALAWPLAHSLPLGVALVGLTGFLEGPAFSGTIAIRQRETPPAVRAQVLTTMSSLGLIASALGAAIGGALHSPGASILAFLAVNVLAALAALSAASAATSKPPPAPEPPPPVR